MNTLTNIQLRSIHKAMKCIEDYAKEIQTLIEIELKKDENDQPETPDMFMYDLKNKTTRIANNLNFVADTISPKK
jgi:uncharacterized protein Yka (UPF0111/DUF47 family)